MPTPLYKLLVSRGLQQHVLAKAIGCGQASVSRLVNGKRQQIDADLAARIVDYLDPARAFLDEKHILYPDRYPDWSPPQTATQTAET